MHLEEQSWMGRGIGYRDVSPQLEHVHGLGGEKGFPAGVWIPLDVCI